MSGGMLQTGADVLGLALIVVAGVAGFGALASRSLFAMCAGLAGAAALGASALLAFGDGDGGLALALAGAGVLPVFALGGLLLSARASKARALPVVSLAIATATVVAIAWVAPELQRVPARDVAGSAAPVLWLAALVFVAVCGCAGLLGYGERGVLDHERDRLP
jgi:hypothetical protein